MPTHRLKEYKWPLTSGLLGLGVGLYTLGTRFRYATGRHIGVISALHKRGVIWKTNEIEFLRTKHAVSETGVLLLSLKGNNSLVRESDLHAKCLLYAQHQTPVILTYERFYTIVPWKGSTSYYLQDIQVLRALDDKKN